MAKATRRHSTMFKLSMLQAQHPALAITNQWKNAILSFTLSLSGSPLTRTLPVSALLVAMVLSLFWSSSHLRQCSTRKFYAIWLLTLVRKNPTEIWQRELCTLLLQQLWGQLMWDSPILQLWSQRSNYWWNANLSALLLRGCTMVEVCWQIWSMQQHPR